MIELMRVLISVGLLLIASEYAWPSDTLPPDNHYCQDFKKDDPDCKYNEAYDFESFSLLTLKQRELLSPILEKNYGVANDSSFLNWTLEHNDFAAEFMTMTKALSRLKLMIATGIEVDAFDIVLGIAEIRGDRMKIIYDPKVFEKWKSNKGRFRMALADGGSQNGSMEFSDHTIFGKGELIDGYDFQWVSGTTSKNSPRFRFNFSTKDNLADFHLDVAVWIWGFIPNFAHLSYGGSDPRQYYKKNVKRFGDPYFSVRQRVIPNPIDE